MQISIETTSGLERRLTISVPSETFEAKISERLASAAKQVRLPGFRPGRVPMREVRRRFGPGVRAEVAGELMQETFVEAVQQEALTPAGSPNLEVVKMDPGIDFEFTATFEVFPSIELADLSRITVRKPEAEITDADVDTMIEQLREQRKTWQAVERGAQPGDRVSVDFEGRLDGEVFEGGTGEDVTFELGAGQMIEDFDQGVQGLAPGDSGSFTATFPDDYGNEALKGRTVTFSVTMKAVEEPRLPELDEEFFSAFGIEEGGLEALRSEVRESMQRELDAAIRNQLKSQVMDELNRLHEIQLPEALVGREIQAQKQQMLQQFQMPGQEGKIPDIDLPDDLFREQAEKRVTVGLVINELIDKSGLEVDEEQLRERVESLAAGYAEPAQVVSYYYSNPEQLQQLKMAVLEDQVIDHILEQADVEVVPTTYADALSGQAIAPPETEAEDDAARAPDSEAETS